jgi:hypothetical protein
MVEELKFGTSINNLLPSEPDTTINHGISRAQEEPTTCKSGVPTQDGSNCSSMRRISSSTGLMERLFQSVEQKMKKVNL